MNLQKHKQTAKGARLLCSLSGSVSLYFLLSFAFSLSNPPGPVNTLLVHFFSFCIRVGSSCRIMQIKWHISMSIAVLLLQFSTFTPYSKCNQRLPSHLRRGWLLSIQFKGKANSVVVINPAEGFWLDLVIVFPLKGLCLWDIFCSCILCVIKYVN